MGLVLKHVVRTKAGTWHYRRRFPTNLVAVIGKGEFKRLLGDTERDALRNFPKINALFERLVSDARRQLAGLRGDATALEVHREAERRATELADQIVTIGDRVLPANDPEAADLVRESYLARFPVDRETGEPTGVPVVEGQALNLLANPGQLSRPSPSIDDAQRLYRRERIDGDINERSKRNQLDLVMRHVKASGLELTRSLGGLTREDARNVRDYMLRDLGTSPATVQRYMNVIRAVVNFGQAEFDLRDAQNPFLNLLVRGSGAAVEERKPFPETLLQEVRQRIEDHAGSDLWQIWRIVENTGCRLGEITGLLVADLNFNAGIPHIKLLPHPHRRLKNAGSSRRVPLIGEALTAAKEARKTAGKSAFLFPRYGRLRGADTASASLMKHIREVTEDKKIVVHSLRHRMEDRLTLAGVTEFNRNLVLGHSHGGMSERYGGAEARLKVSADALEKALSLPAKKDGA